MKRDYAAWQYAWSFWTDSKGVTKWYIQRRTHRRKINALFCDTQERFVKYWQMVPREAERKMRQTISLEAPQARIPSRSESAV